MERPYITTERVEAVIGKYIKQNLDRAEAMARERKSYQKQGNKELAQSCRNAEEWRKEWVKQLQMIQEEIMR